VKIGSEICWWGKCVAEARSNHIVVFCEANGDASVAIGFGERILLEEIEWLRDTAEARPTWGGLTSKPFESWVSIKKSYADDPSLPTIRSREMNGKPPEADAITALKALRLAEKVQPLAVVLLRDVDAIEGRKSGLQQARLEHRNTALRPVTAVIGLPDRYREAWLLAGFQPKSARETASLEQIHKEIQNAHPTRESHRLRDGKGEARCAKDIWERLSDEDATREESCWLETPLEILHEYGRGCGLSAYLEEVKTHLVPLLQAR
jgi:hypothetical protein